MEPSAKADGSNDAVMGDTKPCAKGDEVSEKSGGGGASGCSVSSTSLAYLSREFFWSMDVKILPYRAFEQVRKYLILASP